MSSLTSRRILRDRMSGRSPLVAALDIGSSKIACLIARRTDMENGQVRVCGAGHQSSKGVRRGAVVDMGALERSIRLAVEQAERAAEARVTDVIVGVSGPDIESEIITADVPVVGREITPYMMRDAMSAAVEGFSRPGRELLHATTLGFAVDGSPGVKDPVGMIANTLTARCLAVSGPEVSMRNIAQCVSRAHLNPVAMVAAPYASGLAVLVEDELEQGATVIDMGGGVTSLACFYENTLIHQDYLLVGGSRASSDLAQGLGSTFAAAERLKTLYGAVTLTDIAGFDMVDAPRLGEDGRLEASQASRSEIAAMLRPRVEEILELLELRLSRASARGRPLPRRIVLTGGACQLPGTREVAEAVFRAPVRMARPTRISGMGEAFETPAFATAAGLLKWDMAGATGAVSSSFSLKPSEPVSMFSRAASWIREYF
ncbi:MAG: cell division protein FtsA [Hirschia sp.]|nr:cell division protein FtsA [Hirschia sp.]MBF19542.1 cell division protein FtsA [Hirschia sp.]